MVAKKGPTGRLRARATLVALAVVALGLACALPSSAGVEGPAYPNLLGSARASTSARPLLQQVDGGPRFYARFPNPLPTAASYFPIAVWGSYAHDAGNVAKDRSLGLNTYVWVADSSARYMANIRNAGMHVLQSVDNPANVGSETSGWLLSDEIDMTQGESACPSALNSLRAQMHSSHRGLVYDNYGKGVIFWHRDAQAACFVNYDDVNSADVYWFTDDNVCSSSSEGPRFYGLERALTQAECRRARNYGDVVREMRRFDALNGSPRHPVWAFVEVAYPMGNGMAITPTQARAAVWHSIIAGARGIIYFQHSFSGPCRMHHALRETGCGGVYSAIQQKIRAVDAQIKSLARVLNSPTVTSRFAASRSVRAMMKWSGSKLYVFAGSAENASSRATFGLRCIGNAKATVLGESRRVPVKNGRWTDDYADGNTIHIYRIDGGSTCGLR